MKRIQVIHNRDGLTLIELMIVMVLSLLVMAGAYMAYHAQNKSSNAQHQVTQVQQDLRAAMDIITRDIRNAGCQSQKAIVHPIDASTLNSTGLDNITLYMDLGDGAGGSLDSDVNDTGEHVLYRLDGTDLERIDYNGPGTQIIAQNVTEYSLHYYQYDPTTETSTEIPVASLSGNETQVSYIDVTLTVRSKQRDPDTNQFFSRSLNRRVKLRNAGE